MRKLRRGIVVIIVGGSVLLAIYALVYQWGMSTFEGQDLSYIRSVQVVLEVLTTAGFGGDAPWSSPQMNAVIILMNLTGVLLVFFAIPFFIIPLLETVFETRAPRETDRSGHVIVCADSPRETALKTEIAQRQVPTVFVKQDAEQVRQLARDGVTAIHGNPATAETLRNANISEARGIVVDMSDELNANIILTARRVCPGIRILSVVEDGRTEAYHSYAGADELVRPRIAVGERLAAKAQGLGYPDSVGSGEAGMGSIRVTEVLIESGSDLAGQTLSECSFRQAFGVTVLGGWFHGEFVAPVDPDRELVEHTVLLVAGEPNRLLTLGEHTPAQPCERVIVAGYGVVGQTVTETLRENGVTVTVVDVADREGVDVVGDITEPETLAAADVSDADRVVLALSRDTLVVFAALVLEDVAPDVDTLARADDVSYVQNCYDAGVGYALALSEVTAHMATTRLFDDQKRGGDGGRFEIVRTDPGSLAGERLRDVDIRAKFGGQIIGVARDGTVHANPDPSFVIREEDTVIVGGKATAVTEFESAGPGDRK
jgi:Trk K+ transport system NAD-binding subunit